MSIIAQSITYSLIAASLAILFRVRSGRWDVSLPLWACVAVFCFVVVLEVSR